MGVVSQTVVVKTVVVLHCPDIVSSVVQDAGVDDRVDDRVDDLDP